MKQLIDSATSQSIFGLGLDQLTSSARANYTQENIDTIFEFLSTNRSFLDFAAHNKVTTTTLKYFDLTELRPLLGYDGLEGRRTNAGLPVQEILDTKVRSKLALEWDKWFGTRDDEASGGMVEDKKGKGKSKKPLPEALRERSESPNAMVVNHFSHWYVSKLQPWYSSANAICLTVRSTA